MFKRIVDVTFSGLLLLSVLPFLAFIAVLIKLDTQGPVLFRQWRMGRGFKTFSLFKLRTMRPACEGSMYTLGPDPRITPVGRWIRRLKIDELPQLWNVVRGEMSLVGPRPVVPELAMEFKHDYRRLLAVRPGLTDPATLKYCCETEILARVREPLRYFKRVVTPDKIRISGAYLEESNALTDIWVMARTAFAVLSLVWWQVSKDTKGRTRVLPGPASIQVSCRVPLYKRNLKPVFAPHRIARRIELSRRDEEMGIFNPS